MLIPVTPAEPVITLAEAKAHLRVDFTDDDAYITALVAAATEAVADRTERTLGLQTFDYKVESCDVWGGLPIPAPPLVSVLSVKYVDADGAEQTLAAEDYRVVGIGARSGGGIRLTDGVSWPAVRFGPEALTVRYTAGYSTVPEPLRQAVLIIVGQLYTSRGELVADNLTEDPAVSALLAPYRVLGV